MSDAELTISLVPSSSGGLSGGNYEKERSVMGRARFVRGGVLAGLICAMLSVAGVAAADDGIPVDHALVVVPPVVDPVLPVGAPPEFDAPANFDAPITAHSHSEYAAPVQELRHSAVAERADVVFPVASVMEPPLPLPPIEPILSPADLGPMLERIGLNPSGPALPAPDRWLVDEALGVIAPSVQQLLPGDLGAGVLAGLTGLATMFGPATVPVDSPDTSPPVALLDAGQDQFEFASTATASPVAESVDLEIPTVTGPAAEVAVSARESVEPPAGPIMLLFLIVLGVVITGLAYPLIRRRRAGIRRMGGRRVPGRRTRGHRASGCGAARCRAAVDPAADHRPAAVSLAADHCAVVGPAASHRPADHRLAVGSAAGHRPTVGPAADHRPAVHPAAGHHLAVGSDAGRWATVRRCSRLRPGLFGIGPERRPGRGGAAVRGDPWLLVEHSRCGAGRSPPSTRHMSRSEGVESTAAVEPAAVVSTTLGAAPVT
ncbi:hypothetical protein [Nocardia sp. NPDC060259]|uniref:hypothetical protein n=1 Tax=Nocardia sp. NPDC060259 TaxID=3347088 RepID=UPI00364E6C1E